MSQKQRLKDKSPQNEFPKYKSTSLITPDSHLIHLWWSRGEKTRKGRGCLSQPRKSWSVGSRHSHGPTSAFRQLRAGLRTMDRDRCRGDTAQGSAWGSSYRDHQSSAHHRLGCPDPTGQEGGDTILIQIYIQSCSSFY